jgi:hypothetical protein
MSQPVSTGHAAPALTAVAMVLLIWALIAYLVRHLMSHTAVVVATVTMFLL